MRVGNREEASRIWEVSRGHITLGISYRTADLPRLTDRYAPEYRYFREQLSRLREAAGLSQEQAAALLGKPERFVQRSESGDRLVSFTEAVRFAQLYNVSLDDFVLQDSKPVVARRKKAK